MLKFALSLSLLLLLSCSSYKPLTPALIKEYKLSYDDLKNVQLFLSDGILLERDKTEIDKDIDDEHGLKTVKDNYINQIVFKSKTPGLAIEAKRDKLHVAFEPDDYLTFVLRTNHKKGTVYTLKPNKNKTKKIPSRLPGSGYKGWSYGGKEHYQDSLYNVFLQEEAPYIIVDVKKLTNLILDERKVPGMRPGEYVE